MGGILQKVGLIFAGIITFFTVVQKIDQALEKKFSGNGLVWVRPG